MATYKKFDNWSKNLVNADFTFSDIGVSNNYPNNLFFALSNSFPDKTNNEFITDISQISYTNLLTDRAIYWTLVYNAEGSGNGSYLNPSQYIFSSTLTIQAKSTGSVGPFRYIIFYAKGKYNGASITYKNPLICYYDYGYSLTLGASQSITVNFTELNSYRILNKIV